MNWWFKMRKKAQHQYKIDEKNYVAITFDNSKPVELEDFINAMKAIENSFSEHATKDLKKTPVDTTLYIKEVRSGSIVIELMAAALPVLPDLYQDGILTAWVEWFKLLIEKLDKKEINKSEVPIKTLKAVSSILNPVAKDSASQFNMVPHVNGNMYVGCTFNSEQAQRVKQKIDEVLEKEESQYLYKKQAIRWFQTRFNNNSSIGDMGIIDNIDPKPKKLVFVDNAIKAKIVSGDEKFDKQWNDLIYIVDVEVVYKESKIIMYRILDCYFEETFDPDEID